MPNSPALSVRNPRPAKGALLVVCGCVALCGGCFAAKRPSPHLGAVTFAHPVVPPPHPAEDTVSNFGGPEILVEEGEPIPPLAIPRHAPAKPRTTPPVTHEPAVTEEPPEPILAPEVSDQQVTAAKAAIDQSLSAAERNVSLTDGRTLNAAQQDLVSKIRGFVNSAREAMKNNDWQRARIQAKKAEVLSQEFAPKQ